MKETSLRVSIIIKATLIAIVACTSLSALFTYYIYNSSLKNIESIVREQKNKIKQTFNNQYSYLDEIKNKITNDYYFVNKEFVESSEMIKNKWISTVFEDVQIEIYDEVGNYYDMLIDMDYGKQSKISEEIVKGVSQYYGGYGFINCIEICYVQMAVLVNKSTLNNGFLVMKIPIDNVIYKASDNIGVDLGFLIKNGDEYRLNFSTNFTLFENIYKNVDNIAKYKNRVNIVEIDFESYSVSNEKIDIENFMIHDSEIIISIVNNITQNYQNLIDTIVAGIVGLTIIVSIMMLTINYSLGDSIRYLNFIGNLLPKIGKINYAVIKKELGEEGNIDHYKETSLIKKSTNQLISQLESLHDALRHKQEELQGALEQKSDELDFIEEVINSSGAFFIILDKLYKIIECNNYVTDLLACSSSEIIGRDFRDIFTMSNDPNQAKFNEVEVSQHLMNEEYTSFQLTTDFISRSHKKYLISWNGFSFLKRKHRHYQVICVGLDITYRAEMENNIRRLANTDFMTGLYNRRILSEKTSELYSKEIPFYYINIDIDNFKLINDNYGHDMGDQAIIAVGNMIKSNLPEVAYAARAGGDEFIIVIPEQERPYIESFAKKLINLAANINIRFKEFYIKKLSLSLGIVAYPYDSSDLSEIYSFSDAAMYENKKMRMSSYHFYNGKETMLKHQHDMQFWKEVINSSIEENKILPSFQAIVDGKKNTPVFYEVLSRIVDENGDILYYPDQYIEFIEPNKLIVNLDKTLINKVLSIFSKANEKPMLMINLSNITIASENLADFIIHHINLNGFPPENLVFEITEQSAIHNISKTLAFIETMIRYKVRFALDDFGSGFSSISNLQALPVAFLKIDKSIVQGAGDDRKALKLLTSIVAMAKSLELKVIAEGVETEALHQIIQDLNIDYAQGFLFGYPSLEPPLQPLAKKPSIGYEYQQTR